MSDEFLFQFTPVELGDGFVLRSLKVTDYDLEFCKVLGQLTSVGSKFRCFVLRIDCV